MPPEVLRRIFHPFFTTKEEGSGLGVPAAQKILDAHGGSLDVRSEPGRGTTFIVLVPAFGEEDELG
jgi:signal transduction histidine kinase